MTPPLVEWYIDDVLCDVVEEEPQGQRQIAVTSTILEETKKITQHNSALDAMDINGLDQFQKALIDA